MSRAAWQRGARALGAGRWEVELVWAGATAAPERARLRPRAAGVPAARIELLTADVPGVWRAVVAVDAGARGPGDALEYDVQGAGWPARLRLDGGASAGATALEEPAAQAPASPIEPRPDLDYTARDFDALRTQLLAIVARRTGTDVEDEPVAETMALVELLAYLGDALSYRQDAVATEAHLETARRRVSLTRHAALLDYRVFEGSSARTWVRIAIAGTETITLPARSAVLSTNAADVATAPGLTPAQAAAAARDGALVFESLAAVELRPEAPALTLEPGAHPDGLLPAGATTATVAGRQPDLQPGTLVLLAARHAAHVVRLDAVRRRAAATLVRWRAADALPDDPAWADGPLRLLPHNLVLVEHGATQDWAPLPAAPATGRCWPRLPHAETTFGRGLGVLDRRRSAAATRAGTDRPARAAVELREIDADGRRTQLWRTVDSLLEAGPVARDAVVEIDDDAVAHLRFGDGVNGLRPPPEVRLEARQRVGGGPAGNVAPGTLRHVVAPAGATVTAVLQPVAARGGAEPETPASVRLNAPDAYRVNDRAVTVADFRTQALTVPGVRDAHAGLSFPGAWPVVTVAIHTGGWPTAPAVCARVRRHLERRMPAGIALEVRAARPLAVTVVLDVAVEPGWTLAALGAQLDAMLRATVLAPDRFGFGVALHRSQIVTAVAQVAGVADVTVRRFAWAAGPDDGPARDALVPPPAAIVRIADDPQAPGRGSVAYRLVTATEA